MTGNGGQRSEGNAPEVASGVAPGSLSVLLAELARLPPADLGAAWDSWLRPGAVVGRFELVREIGRGGLGVVYEARDRELKRSVAFKAVRAGGTAALREERLLREAETAARLSHPNIATLYDVGRSEHGPYLVLELLHGETLEERLGQGRVPLREALRIGVEIAKGVAHAHAQGVVHRDLKPSNVFLCEDGQVKVLDFGLAHAFGQRRADGGTPSSMAPEQWKGAPEDERTDVFALGVMLYRMLSGEAPFSEDDGGKAVRSAQRAPPLEVPDEPALGELVGKMLEKDPTLRPRDGGVVLSALSAFKGELERSASAPTSPVPARRRRRWRVPALVAAGILLGTGAAVVALRRPAATAPARGRATSAREALAPSIAVLPFVDMSPKKDQEYLSDGIAEEILSVLSRVEGLRVPGRISSFYFKGRSADLRAIGERLNVASVLEGSVRRSGERIRVTAELVNVADGYRIWSESYERALGEVFAVEDDIARAVVTGLRVKLLPAARSGATAVRTANPEAHAEFLRGKYFHRRTTEREFRLAIAAFERAIALDPGYAPAWAWLSFAQFQLPQVTNSLADDEEAAWYAKAQASAERAIALAPDLADGYAARANLRTVVGYDWAGAGADVERALALAPTDTGARHMKAVLLAVQGRLEEAIAISKDVLREDPLFTNAAANLAGYYDALGRFHLAREVLTRVIEVAPEHAHALRYLAFTEILDGRPLVALEVSRRCPVEWTRDVIEALANQDLGRKRMSDEALARIRRVPGLGYQMVQVHAWRGEADEAFEWLERSLAQHDSGLRGVKFDPFLRKIRGDPRFPAFLKKLNLPVD